MDLNKLVFNSVIALNNSKYPVLVEVAPIWKYIEGKPSDERVGTAYTVLLSGHRFESAVIKTEEKIEAITNDFIAMHGGMVPISAEKFVGKFYQQSFKTKDGDSAPTRPTLSLSLKAKTVIPVDENGNMVPLPTELPFN